MSAVRRRVATLSVAASLLAGLAAAPPAAAVDTNSIVVTTTSDLDLADGVCSFREALGNAINNNAAHAGAGECAAGAADPVEDVITFGFPDAYTLLSDALPTITAGAGPLRIAGDPDPSANNVILDGEGLNRLLVVDGGELVLEKITLARGAGATGTALSVLDGTVVVDQGNFADNTGSGAGAVLWASATSDVTLVGTSIVNNAVSGAGGTAVYSAGILTLDGLVLYDTHAGVGGGGGAISVEGVNAQLSLADSEIRDNDGVGLRLRNQATAVLINVDLLRNQGPSSCGGGIDAQDADLDYTLGEVFGNTASSGGGLCLTSPTGYGTTTLRRLSIVDNAATSVGGGIWSQAPAVTLANTTLSGNHAADAGGLGISGVVGHQAVVNAVNVTLADNWNEAYAGNAAGVWQQDYSTLSTVNTIIGSNLPANLAALTTGITTTHSHGIIDTDVLGTVLTPLDLHGGGLLTHALLPGAATAIDQGDSTACQSADVGGVDERGIARPVGACDIGALERDKGAPAVASPGLAFLAGGILSGASSPAGRLTWTGGDGAGGIGVRTYHVYRSLNGGAYTHLGDAPSSPFAVRLGSGGTYRFRVVAEDWDGNLSAAATTSTYPVKVNQQTSGVTYAGSWSTSSSASYAGGSARSASAKGASASFTAKGRLYAFITTKGPKRGKAKIYVNGVLKATIDLYAPTTQYKVQAWTFVSPTVATRTIRVVIQGTAGRPRVDVDAFAVAR